MSETQPDTEIVTDLAAVQTLATQARPLQLRLEQANRHVAVLQGRRDELAAREQVVVNKVAEAKGRLELKKEVEEALEELRRMAHERSLGAFERMLTAVVQDVQPRTSKRIELELTTLKDAPALNIYANNGNKPDSREGITSGGLANIVSMGLRFIALARSGRTRFILLDEPDCFTENGGVENFFNVIDQLSRDAGIQTVLITHHDLSRFQDRFRIYSITNVDSEDQWPRRMPELVSEGDMMPSALQDRFFSFIDARNFESYTHAHIELSPGVTVITGPNDHCKSGWARMLRAALLGDSGDNNVRHGCKAMSVALGFSDGRVLEHIRRTSGVKGEFILHSPDSYDYMCQDPANWKSLAKKGLAPKALHHSEGATLPTWVPDETGVADIDGFNVALWEQLTPVFALKESPSKRASLLAVGRESGHLHAMTEIYREDLAADRLAAREGEKEVAALRLLLESMQPLDQIGSNVSALGVEFESILKEDESIRHGQDLLSQLQAQLSEVRRLDAFTSQVTAVEQMPEIERTQGLEVWLERVERLKAAIAGVIEASMPAPPELAGADSLRSLVEEMAQLSATLELTRNIQPLQPAPELQPVVVGEELLRQIDRAQREAGIPELQRLEQPQVHATAVLSTLIDGLHDGKLPQLQAVPTPQVQETALLSQLLHQMPALAQDARTRELAALEPQLAQDTRLLQELLEEIARQQSLLQGCRAQEEMLRNESATIDRVIGLARDTLGAHWELDPARLDSMVGQLAQGDGDRVNCSREALRGQLSDAAREGYAHGLSDASLRTDVAQQPAALDGLRGRRPSLQ